MGFNFPDTPTPGQGYSGYVWDGEKWQLQGSTSAAVRYDIAQGLTAAQQSQARANIDVTKKNYILNGAMMISQENGVTVGAVNGYYAADQFFAGVNTTGTFGFVNVPSITPAGSPNRIRFATGTLDTSIAAGEVVYIRQVIEGLRIADLRFGAASAKTFTLQFGVKAPAGTYCVAFLNGAADRSYVAEYVISAGEANTDVVKSVTVTGDVTGTWSGDSAAGLLVNWTLMAGSTYQAAAGAWTATQRYASTNQFNFMSQNANTFELFDVSLTEGTVAPPFVVPDYASELAACQRYFETWEVGSGQYHYFTVGGWSTSTALTGSYYFKVRKRSLPSFSYNALGNFIVLYQGGSLAQTLTSLTANAVTIDGLVLAAVPTTAVGVVGQAGMISQNVNSISKAYFNARL
jgi:hypothetical protein